MKQTCFDIIQGTMPNIMTEEEMKKELSKGVYKWIFDSNLNKKHGYFIPGYKDLLYNFVQSEPGDYVLTIRLTKEKMKIDIFQMTNMVNRTTKIYSVETNFGTVGEKMIVSSVPINDFEKYLMMSMDLRYEYYHDAEDALTEVGEMNKTEIEEKLNKLNELNNK